MQVQPRKRNVVFEIDPVCRINDGGPFFVKASRVNMPSHQKSTLTFELARPVLELLLPTQGSLLTMDYDPFIKRQLAFTK